MAHFRDEIRLSYGAVRSLLHILSGRNDIQTTFDTSRRVVGVSGLNGEELFAVRLPLPFPPPAGALQEYVRSVGEVPAEYAVILIQAGNSALGYFGDGEIKKHKVIRKYMVRKSQGRAQINFLNTKGKSRAGSRVRLAQTVQFFEEINTLLCEWFAAGSPAHCIAYSCPVRLWGMLFKAKVAPPFDKRDPRLCKIGRDVNVPNFEELQRVNRFLLGGFVRIMGSENPAWLEPALDAARSEGDALHS